MVMDDPSDLGHGKKQFKGTNLLNSHEPLKQLWVSWFGVNSIVKILASYLEYDYTPNAGCNTLWYFCH